MGFGGIGDCSLYVLFGQRLALGFARGSELNLCVSERDGLIGVVADDQAHRQDTVLVELHVKHRILLWTIWINGDGHAFILVSFMLGKFGGVTCRRNIGRLVV